MLDPTQYPNEHPREATNPSTVEKTREAEHLYSADEIVDLENPYYTNPYIPLPGITPPPPPKRRRSWKRPIIVAFIILAIYMTGAGSAYLFFRLPVLQSEINTAVRRITPTMALRSTPISMPVPMATPIPTSISTPVSTAPNAPWAIDVAKTMQNLDPQDIYKYVYSLDTSGDAIVTSPFSPGKGTAMIATTQNGWYTIEAFDTTAQAYQDFEANQNISMILHATCLLIEQNNQQQPPTQPILTAFSQAC